MESKLITIFTYLSLVLVVSHATTSSPEDYWNAKLPNTPMPQTLRDHIRTDGNKDNNDVLPANNGTDQGRIKPLTLYSILYAYRAPKDEVRLYTGVDVFFLERNIRKGGNFNFQFTASIPNSITFLPREDVERVPFTSKRIANILSHFSVEPNSPEANSMKDTIKHCERPAAQAEEKYCATSLESMIDYSISKLGKNIYALSTDVERQTVLQRYNVAKVRNISRDAGMTCHAMKYIYPVFYCHNTGTVRLYMISMVGVDDGTRVKAVAICHTDTSAWNPKHLAFQLLKVEPGSDPICHFLTKDHVLWLPK